MRLQPGLEEGWEEGGRPEEAIESLSVFTWERKEEEEE